MAHVDQLLQIDLKQLPLWLCRLALGSHRFSPVFRPFANHYREILDQQSSQIIGFYHGFSGFSATTNLLMEAACISDIQGETFCMQWMSHARTIATPSMVLSISNLSTLSNFGLVKPPEDFQ
jgi:hypothetical protein